MHAHARTHTHTLTHTHMHTYTHTHTHTHTLASGGIPLMLVQINTYTVYATGLELAGEMVTLPLYYLQYITRCDEVCVSPTTISVT